MCPEFFLRNKGNFYMSKMSDTKLGLIVCISFHNKSIRYINKAYLMLLLTELLFLIDFVTKIN